MTLSEPENALYQNILKQANDISLNLMATKVTERPNNFLDWCRELHRLCSEELNLELLEPEQLSVLKKLQDLLETGISVGQLKTLRIAPWPVFFDFVKQQETIHALDERLALLDYTQSIQSLEFSDFIDEDLFTLIGKHTAKHDISVYKFDVEYFSSCKGAKVFIQLLQQFPTEFEAALNEIPLTGEVTKEEYTAFSNAFQAIFQTHENTKAPLAPATRLLALRRPDQFVALTNAKIDLLSQGLSFAKFNSRDFAGYWDELIESVRACAWWKGSEPEDETEQRIWHARAILIDVFFFAAKDFAAKSNYLKLLNKPRKVGGKASTRKPRSKESIEVIVDKALESDDMPDYIKNNRDSIISQVTTGKSVDQVISLMRSIFG